MLLRLHHIAHIADGFNLLPAIAKLVPERLYVHIYSTAFSFVFKSPDLIQPSHIKKLPVFSSGRVMPPDMGAVNALPFFTMI